MKTKASGRAGYGRAAVRPPGYLIIYKETIFELNPKQGGFVTPFYGLLTEVVTCLLSDWLALFNLIFIGFIGQSNVWGPLFWVLAALTMTVGNLIALRQTNIVRMLAYSSIAQAGYILVPFAVAGANNRALLTAKSASILRSTSTPAAFSPAMNRL